MRYALDTEFVDTKEHSHLLSLAIVCEDGRSCYFEFDYNDSMLTPWLRKNVQSSLGAVLQVDFAQAAFEITRLIGTDDKPEFWCDHGAYDWYWLSRVFGGFMKFPMSFPMRFVEAAERILDLPHRGEYGPQHNALADAKSLMHSVKAWHSLLYSIR